MSERDVYSGCCLLLFHFFHTGVQHLATFFICLVAIVLFFIFYLLSALRLTLLRALCKSLLLLLFNVMSDITAMRNWICPPSFAVSKWERWKIQKPSLWTGIFTNK